MACYTRSRKRKRESEKKSNANPTGGADGGGAARSDIRDGGEILWLVLQHLPLWVLFQCKCVCRPWNSIISDPCFRRQYLHRNSSACAIDADFVGSPDALVHTEFSRDHRKRGRNHWRRICALPRFTPFEKHPGPVIQEICRRGNARCFPKDVGVVGSSGGLLLLYNRKLGHYIVYDPLTGATVDLPLAPTSMKTTNVITSFICGEPEETSNGSDYEFKVVRIPPLPVTSPNLEIQMYSSTTRLWITSPVSWQLPEGHLLPSASQNGRAVASGGKLYWTATRQHVGVFDLTTGMVNVLPLPPQPNCLSPCLGEDFSGAILCAVYDNTGLELLRLQRGTITTAVTDDNNEAPANTHRVWSTLHRMEFAEIATKYSIPVASLNCRTLRTMFFGPFLILLSWRVGGVWFDLRSGLLGHVFIKSSQSEQHGTGTRTCPVITYHVPSWPFCLSPPHV